VSNRGSWYAFGFEEKGLLAFIYTSEETGGVKKWVSWPEITVHTFSKISPREITGFFTLPLFRFLFFC